MIRVSIEVASSTAHFRVAVQAENIQRALSLAGIRYPDADLRVLFPIEPEAFFIKATAPAASLVEIEMPEQIAG